MTFPDSTFSDISGSSNLYEQLGDRVAQKIIGQILKRLSDLTVQMNGRIIKTVGDAVIATFSSGDQALDAAKSMQMTMICKISERTNLPPINIHVGIHYGTVVVDNHDIFGDAVNIASRVADYAKPRQIVATRAVIETMSPQSIHLKKFIGRITARNISGEIELFEILYGDQQTTM
ncbi:MAG: adenylate/guanylate cyclase domain-containing protein, partial [Spirochaetaceae bacterium]